MSDRHYHPRIHSLSLLIAGVAFCTIFMGGLVTSHQAGMSVPDWPNSYGYNMFLFPPRLWVGGILYEHTHRLAASVIGLLSIVLTVAVWRSDEVRWVKWLAMAVLGGVIVQGVLGGLRVVFVQLDLAIVHACVAQAFFCLAAFMALVSSRWWIEAPLQPMNINSRRLVALAFVCVGAIFLQLIVGACMRHFKAGLAIPDFPLSYGHWLPSGDLQAINYYRALKLNLDPVTWGQIWLHFAHRVGALAVTFLLLSLIAHVLYHNRRDQKLLVPALVLLLLLSTQVTLGILTVLLRKPADIASAHVAVGALTLVTTFVLAVRARHLYSLSSDVMATQTSAKPSDLKVQPV